MVETKKRVHEFSLKVVSAILGWNINDPIHLFFDEW